MSVLNVISLLAGLAFFLYGVTLMGDGLKQRRGTAFEENFDHFLARYNLD